MPRMLGYEVVNNLREFIAKENETRKVRIRSPSFVIVSAFLNQNLKKHLAEMAIYHTYEKPLQIEELE